jgi:hypothetical protein
MLESVVGGARGGAGTRMQRGCPVYPRFPLAPTLGAAAAGAGAPCTFEFAYAEALGVTRSARFLSALLASVAKCPFGANCAAGESIDDEMTSILSREPRQVCRRPLNRNRAVLERRSTQALLLAIMMMAVALPSLPLLRLRLLLLLTTVSAAAPPRTDYCAMLGEDDIQGKKSGFLAGNQVYYVGGKYEVQSCTENETIGLTHPFYHDLRSRGTGIASYKGVGTGNDFDGWEFHRATQVAAGSVVTPAYTWHRPAPTRMFWRPDKMIVEYELSSPLLAGVYSGWCSNWTQLPGASSSGGTAVALGAGADAAAEATRVAAWQTMPGFACDIGKSPLFNVKVAGPKGSSADAQCQQLCEKKAGCVEWQLAVSSLMCWGYDVRNEPAKNAAFDCGCQGSCSPSPPPPSPGPPPPPPHGGSFWTKLSESECWAHCDADARCNQAVYEANGDGQCWTGADTMTDQPAPSRGGCHPGPCVDKCYAKGKPIPNVTLKEEKFIAANDVVSTIITSDRPVTLEITGRSFAAADGAAGKVISLHGQCSIDKASNSVHILEGGTVSAHVQNGQAPTPGAPQPPIYATGKLMYDGMSGIISASRPMTNASTYTVDPKAVGGIGTVCGYKFQVPVDTAGTTVSWAMHDEQEKAMAAVKAVLADPSSMLAAKTEKMNGLLNDVAPYFRCSDDSIVKLYYYMWSIYLMYFTRGDKGMQVMPHTQTAVNNFLGMHRYDAMMQIPVGSWTNPTRHDFYANGNVLAWSQLLPYRQGPALPDNFGIDWASGCYGGEMIVHVIGACQVYEHSGNMTFLNLSYAFYKELFWDDLGGRVFGYAYESVLCLNKMATILGHANDTAHWNASVGMDSVMQQLNASWEVDTPNMFGSTKGGMGFSNIATAGIRMFPREWVVAMAENWMDDSVKGFNSEVPLTRTALKDWPAHDPGVFAVVPDANWFMIRYVYLARTRARAHACKRSQPCNTHMTTHVPLRWIECCVCLSVEQGTVPSPGRSPCQQILTRPSEAVQHGVGRDPSRPRRTGHQVQTLRRPVLKFQRWEVIATD